MHHVHHLHCSEGLVAVLPLILIHTHQTLVGQEVPKDVVLLILQQHGGFLLRGAVGSLAQRIHHLGEGRTKKPRLITQHIVYQELHGSLLTGFLHVDVGWRKGGSSKTILTGIPIEHRPFHIDSADICQDVIQVQSPLIDDGIVEVGCLVVVLVGLAVECPVHEVGHDTLEVLDAEGGGLDGVVAEVFGEGTRVDGSAPVLCFAVTVFLTIMTGKESSQFLLLVGAGREPTVAPLYRHEVVGSDVGGHDLHTVARLGDVVETGIVHDARRGAPYPVGEGGGTERVSGIGCRGYHVVAKSERVSHLMAGNETDGIANEFVGKDEGTCPWVGGRGLHPNPLADE